MQKIFALLMIIVCCAANCAPVSQKDTADPSKTKHIHVKDLIGLVAKKLKSKELNFDSQVPYEVFGVLKTGIGDASKVLSYDPNKVGTLSVLREKAEVLYAQEKLTSRWLMHLSLCCSELLGDNSKEPSINLFITLGGKNIEDGLEIFTKIEETLRLGYNDDDLSELLCNYSSNGKIITHDLAAMGRTFFNISHLYNDCFWLPIFMMNPTFSFATINYAYAHRIALVAIPFENAEFDGFLNAAPQRFASHDVRHARVFTNILKRNYLRNFKGLDFAQDLWANFCNRIFIKIGSEDTNTSYKEEHFILFLLMHEHQIIVSEGVTLESILKKALEKDKSQYEHDFSSALAFWESQLRTAGVKDARDIRPINQVSLDDTGFITYLTNTSDTPVKFFGKTDSYDSSKRVILSYLSYLRKEGVIKMGPEVPKEEIGNDLCKFLEDAYDRFNKKYQYTVNI